MSTPYQAVTRYYFHPDPEDPDWGVWAVVGFTETVIKFEGSLTVEGAEVYVFGEVALVESEWVLSEQTRRTIDGYAGSWKSSVVESFFREYGAPLPRDEQLTCLFEVLVDALDATQGAHTSPWTYRQVAPDRWRIADADGDEVVQICDSEGLEEQIARHMCRAANLAAEVQRILTADRFPEVDVSKIPEASEFVRIQRSGSDLA